ncbi:MAG: hypothetical protein KA354_23905 [Phycisphaerae bacterium]|nr:hypothetical protein [Phycisphaerae bacterium]
MTDLQRPVRQARRRLWVMRWMRALAWTLAGSAVLFMFTVMVERSFSLFTQSGPFLLATAAGLAGAAVLAAVIWTLATRESMMTAAARLDEAAGLRERVGSGLYCASSSDPFAQAVVSDARQAVRGLAVGRHLPIVAPRGTPYTLGTVVMALLVLWLFPPLDLAGTRTEQEQRKQNEQVVKRSQAQIIPIVKKTMDEIRQKNPAIKDEIDKLEPMEADALQTPLDVRRQGLKQVEKLGQKLEDRKNSEEIGKVNEFAKMMRHLAAESKSQSPVGKLAESMSKGDFKAAQEAMAQIQAKLSVTPKTEAEKKQAEELKAQLAKISAKIDQIAKDDKNMRDKLSNAGLSDKEIKQALQNLSDKKLDAVAKQLASKGLSQPQISQLMQQLAKRGAACDAAKQMAKNMASACKSGQPGQQGQQGQQGADGGQQDDLSGLTAAAQQLSEMESLQQEMNQIASAMADISAAKDSLGNACQACNGTGMVNGKPCSACNGSGMHPGSAMGQGQGPGPGMGPNPGQGQGGVAPSAQTAFRSVERRSSVITKPGSIISQKFINGEQIKGDVSTPFKEAMISAERDVTDAIEREQIPRQYQSSVKNYFTRARETAPPAKDEPPTPEKK